MTARNESGRKVWSHRKIWQELGVDLHSVQQVKSWEIKNTIDLSLQPRQTHTERLLVPLPEGTRAAEIEAVITYQHRPGEEFVVHRLVKKLPFK